MPRGCPFSCIFCVNNAKKIPFRYRSPDKILEELLLLKQKYKIKSFSFFDDTFSVPRKKIIDICKLMIKNDLNLKWDCLSRVDSVDKEVLTLMKYAGCFKISFGCESGSDETLKYLNKGITTDQIRQAFHLCDKIGIKTTAYFTIGAWNENERDIRQTIDFARYITPGYAIFFIMSPKPNSGFWRTLKEKQIIKGVPSEGHENTSTNYLSNMELHKLQLDAYCEFYLDPIITYRRVLKQGSIFNKIEFIFSNSYKVIDIIYQKFKTYLFRDYRRANLAIEI